MLTVTTLLIFLKMIDLQTCKIEPGKEFYLSFPKKNNVFQNANISNRQIIHTNSFRNESRNYFNISNCDINNEIV